MMRRQKEKRVSFRVRRQYYDAIVSGEKTVELRRLIPYWEKRLVRVDRPDIAVFVCGKQVHRRRIKRVLVGEPETILGRELTTAEKNDVPTELCIAIELGEVVQK